MNKIEKIRLKLSLSVPVLFLVTMWIVKIFENSFDLHLYRYGIFPHNINTLTGIITSPFIHGSFKHLLSNSIPFLFLSAALFYFYKESAYKVFIIIWIFTGLWVWLAARPSYHIGASGMIYGFAAFLFFSGLIHKKRSLASLSLLIVFLYGGMVWGVLPLKPEISWESHLFGAITGLITALFFAPKHKEEEKTDEKYSNIFDNEFSKPHCSDINIKNINYLYNEDAKSEK